jgi:hypothetical protein
LLVADLFHPIDTFAVELFHDCDVRHCNGRCATVPMLLARRTPDSIAGPDFLFGLAPTLRPAASGGDYQRLAERMGMPCSPGSGFTNAPKTRAGSGGSKRGSIRTEPVKFSAGPLREDCEPLRLISIFSSFR